MSRVWRGRRIAFTPTTCRASYISARDFSPINLTTFILKTGERLLNGYIRERPVSRKLFGKTFLIPEETIDVNGVKYRLALGGLVTGTFKNIEGTFDNIRELPQLVVRFSLRIYRNFW